VAQASEHCPIDPFDFARYTNLVQSKKGDAMPKSEASKRWDAKNMKVLSVNLKVAEALEVQKAAIEDGLTGKQWIVQAIREKLAKRGQQND
jgi:hypothetical protein